MYTCQKIVHHPNITRTNANQLYFMNDIFYHPSFVCAEHPPHWFTLTFMKMNENPRSSSLK